MSGKYFRRIGDKLALSNGMEAIERLSLYVGIISTNSV